MRIAAPSPADTRTAPHTSCQRCAFSVAASARREMYPGQGHRRRQRDHQHQRRPDHQLNRPGGPQRRPAAIHGKRNRSSHAGAGPPSCSAGRCTAQGSAGVHRAAGRLGTPARSRRGPPIWLTSSAAPSSPRNFRRLVPTSQPAKKSTSSAWPGKISRHNREVE
jgi:hypothetical protein